MENPERDTFSFAGTVSDSGRTIRIAAPAKINLFLKVLGKRPDGYHDIFSWFQALDLADRITLTITDDTAIVITTNSPEVPTDSSNLVYQAARRILDRAGRTTGLLIDLDKRIPVAAGLGGGSSDAAAVIKGLNRLFDLRLSRDELSAIGLEIGSDVPFFFSRGQAEVSGRGEVVTDIELPVDYTVALVTPRLAIRAAEAYQRLSLDLTEPIENSNFTCCREASELFGVISQVANDLERALRKAYPVLDKIGDVLASTQAEVVRLSGSGPTVFGLYYSDALVTEEFASSFVGKGWDLCFANPVILPHWGMQTD